MQSVGCYSRESSIVQDYNRVGVLGQSAESEEGVVGLDDDSIVGVWEDRVGLDQLLREAVVQSLEQEGAETRSCTTSDGVEQHEALYTQH